MARRVSVQLVDDIDGGVAGSTVHFAVDGRWYDIDLSAANEKALRAALAPFLAAARRVARRSVVPPTRAAGPARPAVPAPARAVTGAPEPGPAERSAQPVESAAPVPAAAFSNPATPVPTQSAGRPSPSSVGIFTHAS